MTDVRDGTQRARSCRKARTMARVLADLSASIASWRISSQAILQEIMGKDRKEVLGNSECVDEILMTWSQELTYKLSPLPRFLSWQWLL